MAGVSDKARFYLERSVPQLQEFVEKKIFTQVRYDPIHPLQSSAHKLQDEIKAFVKKRSDFEHKVNARGSTPVDFAQYAAWETNLERLRHKRCVRMRIKNDSRYAGPARIFQVLDRGTKKHPGDVALWMSYLECARKAKSTKKFQTVLTAAIRLHPTKPDFWLYAARWSLENDADITVARSYMQRGTRFCNQTKDLWIEYAKLEMIYLAKIAMRRRILGLDVDETIEMVEDDGDGGEDGFATAQDMILISDVKTQTLRPDMIKKIEVDSEAKKDPMDTPALQGAIPMAIYDAARNQPFFCAAVAEAFFNMFSVFTQVRSLPKILQHVLDSMLATYPKDPSTFTCYIRQPIITLDPMSAEFPMALATSLSRVKEAIEEVKDRVALAKKTKAWIEPILLMEDLDQGVNIVLQHIIQRVE